MKSGIYRIRNVVNGKLYIGSTKDFSYRKHCHFKLLKENKHHSIKLQRAYNKYGADKFVFEVIVKCPVEYLLKVEQWFFDTSFPDYNISKTAKANYVKKKNVSNFSKKGNPGVRSEKSKKQMSVAAASRKRKVYQIDLTTYEIIAEFASMSETSKTLNIPVAQIKACCHGRNLSAKGYIFCLVDKYSISYLITQKNKFKRYKLISQIKNGVTINTFAGVQQASKETGVTTSNIHSCLKQHSNTAGGYEWKYKELC